MLDRSLALRLKGALAASGEDSPVFIKQSAGGLWMTLALFFQASLFVALMRVNNPDRVPLGINRGDTAPTKLITGLRPK
jgi:hypothetical protein